LYVDVSKTHKRLALPINKALLAIIEEMISQGELPASGYIFTSDKMLKKAK